MRGGGATWHENQLVPVTRHGRLEQVYWTYGYSPIDEGDGVGGVLVVCRDVTRDYLAAAALREREAELARVQQFGASAASNWICATGFHNRRSPEYLADARDCRPKPPRVPRGLGAASASRGSRCRREAIPRGGCRRHAGDIPRSTGSFGLATATRAGYPSAPRSSAMEMAGRSPGRGPYRCHRTSCG